MASEDLRSNITVQNAFNTQTISSDTTTNGVIIDTAGYEGLTFVIKAGAVTAGDVTPLIQDGEDSGLSDAANVADDFLIGTEAAAQIDAANEVFTIGYVGKKRYVRLSLVSANSANLVVGGEAILSDARHERS